MYPPLEGFLIYPEIERPSLAKSSGILSPVAEPVTSLSDLSLGLAFVLFALSTAAGGLWLFHTSRVTALPASLLSSSLETPLLHPSAPFMQQRPPVL
jgi:hypothetical protein